MIVLVGHYDEPVDPRQPVPGNLAQQLAAQSLIAPCLPGAYQLEATQGVGEEETATGDQLLLLPDPPPLTQPVPDHRLIQLAA